MYFFYRLCYIKPEKYLSYGVVDADPNHLTESRLDWLLRKLGITVKDLCYHDK